VTRDEPEEDVERGFLFRPNVVVAAGKREKILVLALELRCRMVTFALLLC